MHTEIRSRECCTKSSTLAINLARKYGSRLHVLHLTTEDEVDFFSNDNNVSNKLITAEVCIHHMLYSKKDYARKKGFIIAKCKNCEREIEPKKRQCPYCGILNPTVTLKDIFLSLAFVLVVMAIVTYFVRN